MITNRFIVVYTSLLYKGFETHHSHFELLGVLLVDVESFPLFKMKSLNQNRDICSMQPKNAKNDIVKDLKFERAKQVQANQNKCIGSLKARGVKSKDKQRKRRSVSLIKIRQEQIIKG